MGKHQQHAIRNNSVAAHNETRDIRSKRTAEVIGAYKAARRPQTDREIMQRLHFVDPNAVRPEITKLIDKMVLKEVGDTKCHATGRTVRLVALASYKEHQQKLF